MFKTMRAIQGSQRRLIVRHPLRFELENRAAISPRQAQLDLVVVGTG
jgi:hypothetical protein